MKRMTTQTKHARDRTVYKRQRKLSERSREEWSEMIQFAKDVLRASNECCECASRREYQELSQIQKGEIPKNTHTEYSTMRKRIVYPDTNTSSKRKNIRELEMATSKHHNVCEQNRHIYTKKYVWTTHIRKGFPFKGNMSENARKLLLIRIQHYWMHPDTMNAMIEKYAMHIIVSDNDPNNITLSLSSDKLDCVFCANGGDDEKYATRLLMNMFFIYLEIQKLETNLFCLYNDSVK